MLSYFGAIICYVVALPDLRVHYLDKIEKAGLLAGSVLGVVGSIILWATPEIGVSRYLEGQVSLHCCLFLIDTQPTGRHGFTLSSPQPGTTNPVVGHRCHS